MADWPIIIARFARYLTLGTLFGLAAFSLYGVRPSERTVALTLRPWLVAGATLGLLLSVVALVAFARSILEGLADGPVRHRWRGVEDLAGVGAIGVVAHGHRCIGLGHQHRLAVLAKIHEVV